SRGKELVTMRFRSTGVQRWLASAALALAAAGLGACSNAEHHSDLRPEGPPDILQMFAIDDDPVQGTISKMACGDHCDINDVPATSEQNCSTTDTALPINGFQNGPVTNGLVAGQRIRVIFDELLKPSTVEQFRCACWPNCSTRGHTFSDTEVD